MLNGETEQKQSVHFFALMLALSLCMHTALCIFFYCIGVTILYVFNIASVVIYLLLLFLYSPLKDIFAPYYLPCYVSLFAISSYFPTAKSDRARKKSAQKAPFVSAAAV